MKLVIIGIVLAIVVALVSFFGGWQFAQKSQEVHEMKIQMHDEHSAIVHKVDRLEMKLDSMDKKLDILVNIATRPTPYEIDLRK